MKKSRIIIPALAMIAFSVAASITGTVAWFTATRTANIDAGTYTVVKTTANMTKTVTAGLGTSVDGSGAVTVDGVLTDGSFDHAGTNKYIYAPDKTGTKVGGRYALASATESNLTRGEDESHNPIYTAVTWSVKFSMEFGASGSDIGLFLDLSTSVFDPDQDSVASGKQDTAKGFRMAFIPTGTNAASGTTRVFADLQAAANCKYVNGEPAVSAALPAGASYSSPILIDNSNNNGLADSYAASAVASMTNYFGTFTFAANTTVDLEYTVVCWFEGTDPNIINGDEDHETVFNDVAVSLDFAAIDLE